MSGFPNLWAWRVKRAFLHSIPLHWWSKGRFSHSVQWRLRSVWHMCLSWMSWNCSVQRIFSQSAPAPYLLRPWGWTFWESDRVARRNRLGPCVASSRLARGHHQWCRYRAPRPPRLGTRRCIWVSCGTEKTCPSYWMIWTRAECPQRCQVIHCNGIFLVSSPHLREIFVLWRHLRSRSLLDSSRIYCLVESC